MGVWGSACDRRWSQGRRQSSLVNETTDDQMANGEWRDHLQTGRRDLTDGRQQGAMVKSNPIEDTDRVDRRGCKVKALSLG